MFRILFVLFLLVSTSFVGVEIEVTGIPQEGVAVSNYPKLRPPDFKKAAVKNPNGMIRLKLSY